jgi:formate dehydrogenase iron-sulfur subunit
MSSLQSLDIAKRSATTTPSPNARGAGIAPVAKLIDVSSCIGCKACQAACMQWNDLRDEIGDARHGTYDNPVDQTPQSWTGMRCSEVEPTAGRLEWLIRKDGCMHCEDPGCLKACPAPGAIVKYANGIVDFISEHCIGCGYCVKGCPFAVPRISAQDNKADKCSLCADRVAVGQEPACAKACPTGAIRFGGKPEMLGYAASRVAELKTRGYEQAAVYNPEGVGGTHVMYVLQHGDQPALYAGLPANPSISALVGLWKGFAKPLALVALAGLLHHIKQGPLETPDDDGDEGAQGSSGKRATAQNV